MKPHIAFTGCSKRRRIRDGRGAEGKQARELKTSVYEPRCVCTKQMCVGEEVRNG